MVMDGCELETEAAECLAVLVLEAGPGVDSGEMVQNVVYSLSWILKQERKDSFREMPEEHYLHWIHLHC